MKLTIWFSFRWAAIHLLMSIDDKIYSNWMANIILYDSWRSRTCQPILGEIINTDKCGLQICLIYYLMLIRSKLFPFLISFNAMFLEIHRRTVIDKMLWVHSILKDLSCLNNNISFVLRAKLITAMTTDLFLNYNIRCEHCP